MVPPKASRKKAVKKTAKKAVKKAATKKPAKQEAQPIESVQFKRHFTPGLDSKYRKILEKMQQLKPGECFVVDIPADTNLTIFRNRINAGQAYFKIMPPKGCRFTKRTMEDGRLGICLLEPIQPLKPRKKKAKKK